MALDKFQPYLFVSAGEQSNKFLTPVISQNGIASFQAQRAQELTGLTVRIDAIQEGTGDPSPSNVRAISGRTGLTIDATAANIWDGQTTVGGYYDDTGAWCTDSGVLGVANAIPVRPGMQLYCHSANGAAVYVSLFSRMVTIGTSATDAFISRTRRENQSFTIPDGVECLYFNFAIAYGTTYQNDVSINYPATVQDMSPTARIIPIDWQTDAGTIYGGTLDVVSGVLTVTQAGIRLTSDNQSWSTAGSVSAGTARYYCTLNPAADASTREIMCSHAINVNGNASPWGTCFLYNGIFAMKNGDGGAGFSSLADFKTWLDENNLQVCYKLATPQTYQLTPAKIKTLAGFNQIYSDAGPVIDIKF